MDMRLSTRTKGILCWIAVLLIAVTVVIAALGWAERERNKEEEYRVYSAYLSEGLLNDAHDWSVDVPVGIVIADRTISGGNLRFRLLFLFDRRVDFLGLLTSTKASYLARNLFRTRIESKFSLPARATAYVTPEDEHDSLSLQVSQEKFPHNMGLVTLSGVGFNPSRTQAVFYINHFCGLCGGGRYVLMERVNGSWRVKEEHYIWIS
jgi:hypothetical protein